MRIHRVDVGVAVQMAAVALLAYLAGSMFTELFHRPSSRLGGLWALISGLVVLQDSLRETLRSASVRVRGTFIGAAVAAACLSIDGYSFIGMGASIVVTILICHLIGLPDHARLACITIALIMVISSDLAGEMPPWGNAALRFAESCLGTAMAIIAALLWPGKAPRQPISAA